MVAKLQGAVAISIGGLVILGVLVEVLELSNSSVVQLVTKRGLCQIRRVVLGCILVKQSHSLLTHGRVLSSQTYVGIEQEVVHLVVVGGSFRGLEGVLSFTCLQLTTVEQGAAGLHHLSVIAQLVVGSHQHVAGGQVQIVSLFFSVELNNFLGGGNHRGPVLVGHGTAHLLEHQHLGLVAHILTFKHLLILQTVVIITGLAAEGTQLHDNCVAQGAGLSTFTLAGHSKLAVAVVQQLEATLGQAVGAHILGNGRGGEHGEAVEQSTVLIQLLIAGGKSLGLLAGKAHTRQILGRSSHSLDMAGQGSAGCGDIGHQTEQFVGSAGSFDSLLGLTFTQAGIHHLVGALTQVIELAGVAGSAGGIQIIAGAAGINELVHPAHVLGVGNSHVHNGIQAFHGHIIRHTPLHLAAHFQILGSLLEIRLFLEDIGLHQNEADLTFHLELLFSVAHLTLLNQAKVFLEVSNSLVELALIAGHLAFHAHALLVAAVGHLEQGIGEVGLVSLRLPLDALLSLGKQCGFLPARLILECLEGIVGVLVIAGLEIAHALLPGVERQHIGKLTGSLTIATEALDNRIAELHGLSSLAFLGQSLDLGQRRQRVLSLTHHRHRKCQGGHHR